MKNKRKIILILLTVILAFSTCFMGCTIQTTGGNSIVSIQKTETNGLVDTYTIIFSNGTTSTFTVTNGANGQDGGSGQDITIEAIFNKWLEENPNGSYESFLTEYLNVQNLDNSVVVGKALLSSLKVYSEFTLTYSYTTSQTWNYINMGSGSAVIYKIDDDYTYLITNYHVICNSKQNKESKIATKITAYLYGSESSPVETEKTDSDGYIIYDYGVNAINLEYVGGSAIADIAVLRAETATVKAINPNATAIEFADGYTVGETAIAIGNPGDDGISVTQGVVSMDNELITLSSDGNSRTHRSIRIDTPLYAGNSGGGLFNKYGKVIGITNAGSTQDQNVNYAVPVQIAKPVVENIMYYKNGYVNKITLGVTVQKGSSKYVYDEATGLGKVVSDIDVVEITTGSIASRLAIQADDKLISLNVNSTKNALNQYFDIGDMLYTVKVGDEISFDYIRDGQTFTSVSYVVQTEDVVSID